MISIAACSNWGTYLFLTSLPSYMKEVLKFDIKSNGALSALPYLVFWLFITLSGIFGDKMVQSFKMDKTRVRKIFNSLGKLKKKLQREKRRRNNLIFFVLFCSIFYANVGRDRSHFCHLRSAVCRRCSSRPGLVIHVSLYSNLI
jgi:hypothetical protein